MKKHKGLFICLGVLLILGIVAFFGLKNLLYPDGSKNKYGDRLTGIEKVPISDSTVNDMKEAFLKNENVISFEYKLTGRIIKIFVKVKDNTKVDTVKELSNLIVKDLTDEQKSFYDILYYVTCENEEPDLYPLSGNKHKTSDVFSWTLKREKIVKEEEKGVENAE